MPNWLLPLASFVVTVVVPIAGMILVFERRLSRVETQLENVDKHLTLIKENLGVM